LLRSASSGGKQKLRTCIEGRNYTIELTSLNIKTRYCPATLHAVFTHKQAFSKVCLAALEQVQRVFQRAFVLDLQKLRL
jgi:hypothetical protein